MILDDNGKPLAVVEAKKTAVDAEKGRHQARYYADGLEKMRGQRPVIFYTNGYDIWMWDDHPAQGYPPRRLYDFYSKSSLQHQIRKRRGGVGGNVAVGSQALAAVAIHHVAQRSADLVAHRAAEAATSGAWIGARISRHRHPPWSAYPVHYRFRVRA